MDLQTLSNTNGKIFNKLNFAQNNSDTRSNPLIMDKKQNNSGIVLVKKGETGYIKDFDLDNDGEITLEEFNSYCEENGISEKDKLKLLSLFGMAKKTSKIVSKTFEDDKKDESKDTENDKSIYARKGDEKYNEMMDTDKNDIVTYKEYIDYCNKKARDSQKDNTTENKAIMAYLENEHYQDEAELSVETQA